MESNEKTGETIQSLKADNDHLKINTRRAKVKQIGNEEQILYSIEIKKYKDSNVNSCQTRALIITDQYLYNFKYSTFSSSKLDMMRKIDLKNISGVTISKNSDQFVVHVQNESDYRFVSDKRFEIIEVLRKTFLKLANQQMSFFYKDEESLFQFTTQKSDVKKNVSRRPQEVPTFYGDEAECSRSLYRQTVFKQDMSLKQFSIINVIGKGSISELKLANMNNNNNNNASAAKTKYFVFKCIECNKICMPQAQFIESYNSFIQKYNQNFLINPDYIFCENNCYYIVMDFMRGGDLYTLLNRKQKISEKQAKMIFCEITLALNYLHEQNLYFQDLKPENVLIDEEGHIRLTEFAARFLNEQCQKQMPQNLNTNQNIYKIVTDTPAYIAPEALTAKHDNNLKYFQMQDWYKLGILLYEMLIGISPFYHHDVNVTFQMVLCKEPSFPSDMHHVSEACVDIIQKLLIKTPEKRLGGLFNIQQHQWLAEVNWQLIYDKYVLSQLKLNSQTNNILEHFNLLYLDKSDFNNGAVAEFKISQMIGKTQNFS